MLKVKGQKKTFCANSKQKRIGVGIRLVLDKIDCKPEIVLRNKNVYYILIKKSLHQEDIIYAPTEPHPKYMKQTLTELKRKLDRPIRIVRNFNISLSKNG